MNKTGKTLILVLVVALLALTIASLVFLKKENELRVSAEKKLTETEAAFDKLEVRFNDSNSLISQLNAKIKESQVKIEDLAKELDLAKTNEIAVMEEKDAIKRQLDEMSSSKTVMLERLENAQKELENIKTKLKSISDEKMALEGKLKELQETVGVDLDKIVVSYPETTEEPQVMTVGRDQNFLVVNLGAKDNIALGQSLYIYQNNKLLGEVKVEKVMETMSAATINDSNLKSRVKEGDVVKLQK